MRLAVIGTGYVGLVAGTCFADTGNQVLCVDINAEKVAKLSAGESIIYEPGLEEVMLKNIQEKRLSFTVDIKNAIQKSQVLFIAVGTPSDEDGSADLKHVLKVAESIGRYMDEYKVIVNKSTVPVGTADLVAKKIQEELDKRSVDYSFDVVSNPEFLKEGSAIVDFTKPDRVVLGSSSLRAIEIMKELYAPFFRTNERLYLMDNRSAEVTKYAANSLLATKISFMNEIANLCQAVGADVNDVRKAIGADSRIGNKFLFPGLGYGGSCFPKDVKALVKTGLNYGLKMDVLEAVEEVNCRQKGILLEKIEDYYQSVGQKFINKTVAVWGLSFKPNTDDIREAPALTVIDGLLAKGCQIKAYDPVAMENVQKIYNNKVFFGHNAYDVLAGADFLIINTEWNEFRTPDFDQIAILLAHKVIFDGRNLFNPELMKKKGFRYFSIGRKNV